MEKKMQRESENHLSSNMKTNPLATRALPDSSRVQDAVANGFRACKGVHVFTKQVTLMQIDADPFYWDWPESVVVGVLKADVSVPCGCLGCLRKKFSMKKSIISTGVVWPNTLRSWVFVVADAVFRVGGVYVPVEAPGREHDRFLWGQGSSAAEEDSGFGSSPSTELSKV